MVCDSLLDFALSFLKVSLRGYHAYLSAVVLNAETVFKSRAVADNAHKEHYGKSWQDIVEGGVENSVLAEKI